jgi:TatA/E family protein of Tat protein translocase
MITLSFISMPSTPELLVIFAVALLVFGPKSLPSLARTLGRSIRDLKGAADRLTTSVMEEPEPVRPSRPAETVPVRSSAPPPAKSE